MTMEVTHLSGQTDTYRGLVPSSLGPRVLSASSPLLVGSMAVGEDAQKDRQTPAFVGCIAELRASRSVGEWRTLALQDDALGGAGIEPCDV